ncbi:hypothetical protein Clacol_004015 [Clathrus columnatus]|uniref:Amino acid permease/ SLC12A domain-containing protein n=1 Tax=Clathrus columnatus TaxID=1419009 RepID=A0AAV5A9W1_9AGAM|nr:hypothetical protein Clacol_004015 [Clathrus columnatus]
MPQLSEKDRDGEDRDVGSLNSHESDIETLSGPGLKRQLKNRHIAMISIGGVIGTGLFLGTASPLRNGGPLGLLLGYMVVGSMCYSTMICVGEMIAYLPIAGGPIKLAERFVNRSFSFTLGWNYWYNWAMGLPAELSAASILMNFWNKSVSSAVWITVFYIVVLIINLFGAGLYGECEFYFASIKVLTITGLIILGIVLDLGGGPDHDRIGFRFWKNPGPFVQADKIPGATGRFLGWWLVMSQAAFSFIGTEAVALAAGEARNPHALAISGNAPKVLGYTTKRGLPLFTVLASSSLGLLAYMATSSGSGRVFGWFVNMTAIAGLMGWFGISFTYLRFYAGLKAQGISRDTLPYKAPFQPYAAWYTLISTLVVCFFSGVSVFLKGHWATDTFVTNYLPFVLFPILYFGARHLLYKEPMIAPQDMDFVSGLDKVAEDTYDEKPPRNCFEKFWQWLSHAMIFIANLIHNTLSKAESYEDSVKYSPISRGIN